MRYQISRVLKREQVMKLTAGNCSRPKNVLGRHLLEHGQVIAAFHPEAVRMTLCIENGEEYPMDMVERQPVFALFLPCRQAFSYQIVMEYGDGKQMVIDDPYSFDCQITGKEEAKFLQGKWPEAYCKLGAHPMTVGGTEGAYFALWMPGVKRVSVLGSFNQWDSAMYPMNRMENAEIYELFLPGVKEGEDYCFEIKTMQDRIFRIADPFGLAKEPGVKNISKILNIHVLPWMDDVWMANRRSRNGGSGSMVIGMMAEDTKRMDDFLQETCTHILISQQKRENMGCREAILGQYFLPPFCVDSPKDFHSMIEKAHQRGVGVLMEIFWDSLGVVCGEMTNFLLSSLMFWVREYHVDGFLFRDIRRTAEGKTEVAGKTDLHKEQEDSSLAAARNTGTEVLKQAVCMLRREDKGILFVRG